MGITSRRHTQLHAQMQLTPVPPPGSAQWGFIGVKKERFERAFPKSNFANLFRRRISGIFNAYIPFDQGDYDLLHLL